jgi:hypothetical protein
MIWVALACLVALGVVGFVATGLSNENAALRKELHDVRNDLYAAKLTRRERDGR